ncbi:CLCA1 regulator, partial [Polypterus senegalus]
MNYGNDPYTLQYGGCGEAGRYIHLTPDFLIDDKFLRIYGPRERVLVHEWAHLRWGVYDEYNEDKPFYFASDKSFEATRCSVDITGVMAECKDPQCSAIKPCEIDKVTGSPTEKCKFFPDKKQRTTSSIMFVQGLNVITEFCNQNTHNAEAPNMQNKMCKSKSVWEVIEQSKDFKASVPMNENAPPPTTFTYLQGGDRVICLVLDVSSNMKISQRKERLRQAAELFILQFIETGSFLGIVQFNSKGKILQELTHIEDDNFRITLANRLPNLAEGGLNICEGIRTAFRLEIAGKKTQGKDWLNGTVSVDRTIGNDTVFVVTWETMATPAIYVFSPSGQDYSADFVVDMALKESHLKIPGTAETLTMTVTSRAGSSSQPSVTVNAYMNKDSTNAQSPFKVYAEVSKGYLPVLGAKVTASIESDTNKEEFQLLDNGAGADIIKNDGVYSGYFFKFSGNGRYSLKVKAQGIEKVTRLSFRKGARAYYIPGYHENGYIFPNPQKPPVSEEDHQSDLGSFTRTTSGGVLVVTGMIGLQSPSFPPCQITDLDANIEGEQVSLSWTAPGEHVDQGTEGEVVTLAEALRDGCRGYSTLLNCLEDYANEREGETVREKQVATSGERTFQPLAMLQMPAVSKATLNPGHFDGKGAWETYYTRFRMVAMANRWHTQEEAVQLAAALEGDALNALTDFGEEELLEVGTLAAALEQRFVCVQRIHSGHQTAVGEANS